MAAECNRGRREAKGAGHAGPPLRFALTRAVGRVVVAYRL